MSSPVEGPPRPYEVLQEIINNRSVFVPTSNESRNENSMSFFSGVNGLYATRNRNKAVFVQKNSNILLFYLARKNPEAGFSSDIV